MKTCLYKVVLLGNHGVGKTSLFRKLKGKPSDESSSTTTDSIDLTPCTLEFRFIEESVKIVLEVTDTGSVERFRGSIPTNYFRFAQGVVLMYDLTDPTSLYDLEDWMAEAYNKTPDGAAILYALIGNKKDETDIEVDPRDEPTGFAERHDIPQSLHFRVSAEQDSTKTLQNVFKKVALKIHKLWKQTDGVDSDMERLVLIQPASRTRKKEETGCFRC